MSGSCPHLLLWSCERRDGQPAIRLGLVEARAKRLELSFELGEERADGRVVRRELGELAKRLRRAVGDRPAALGDRARLRAARELTQRAHGDLGANAPFIGPPW